MTQQKKILSGLFLIVLLNVLVKPFYLLGIDAEVQNRIGVAAYGNYFSLLNFSFLLNILLDLGITNFNTRNLAQHPQLISKHFGKILAIRFSLFGLYAVFTLSLAIFSGYSGQEFILLGILAVNQFLVAIIQFARSCLGGLHLFKTDAIISVADRLLLICFCSILLWTTWSGIHLNAISFVLAQTLAYFIAAILALFVLLRETGSVRINFKWAFSYSLIRSSVPYAVLIILMMFYNRIDAVMLERLLPDGDFQAGIYAQGFRFLDAVNMFALLFAGILLPVFSRMLKHGEPIQDLIAMSMRMLLPIAIFTGVICAMFANEILALRYSDTTLQSSSVFTMLMFSFIPVSITYIFGTLLTANGNLKQLNYMAASGLMINLLLNFILIPTFKAEGAAWATLITQVITALIQVGLAVTMLKLKLESRIWIQLIAYASVITLFCWGIQRLQLSWYWQFLCAVIASIGFMLVFRFFRMRELRQMLAMKEN